MAAAPQAIIASATGGTSVAAQSAANLAAVNAGNAGLAAVISNSLNTMAKNPSYWLSVMQTIDSDYDDAKAKGVDDLTALATALITSALNAGVEIGGGIETLPQSVREGGEDAIALWVKPCAGQLHRPSGHVDGCFSGADRKFHFVRQSAGRLDL